MATRQSAVKTLLGEPGSVLAREWLEAYHGGGEYDKIIPWDFKNRVKLTTGKQVNAKSLELYELDRVAPLVADPLCM